jgi:hypothetical protein
MASSAASRISALRVPESEGGQTKSLWVCHLGVARGGRGRLQHVCNHNRPSSIFLPGRVCHWDHNRRRKPTHLTSSDGVAPPRTERRTPPRLSTPPRRGCFAKSRIDLGDFRIPRHRFASESGPPIPRAPPHLELRGQAGRGTMMSCTPPSSVGTHAALCDGRPAPDPAAPPPALSEKKLLHLRRASIQFGTRVLKNHISNPNGLSLPRADPFIPSLLT